MVRRACHAMPTTPTGRNLLWRSAGVMSHGLVLQRRVAPGELRGSGHRGLLHLNDLNEYLTAMNSKKASFPELKETERAATADYRERCMSLKKQASWCNGLEQN